MTQQRRQIRPRASSSPPVAASSAASSAASCHAAHDLLMDRRPAQRVRRARHQPALEVVARMQVAALVRRRWRPAPPRVQASITVRAAISFGENTPTSATIGASESIAYAGTPRRRLDVERVADRNHCSRDDRRVRNRGCEREPARSGNCTISEPIAASIDQDRPDRLRGRGTGSNIDERRDHDDRAIDDRGRE